MTQPRVRRLFGYSLLGVTAGLVLTSGILVFRVTHPRHFRPEEFAENKDPVRQALRQTFPLFPQEEVNIHSPFGYPMHGLFLPLDDAVGTVMICHGIGCDLTFAARYLTLYRKRGWSILLVDLRHHGQSGGRNCTFGYYEKHDMLRWAGWVRERQGGEKKVGVHGESLGAAVALQYAALDRKTAFCVADCSYADLPSLFRLRLARDYHLAAFPFYFLASLESRITLGMWFSQASPLLVIDRVHAPVLFVHGLEDDLIPPEHSLLLYQHKVGAKALYLVPSAGHAESFWKDEAEYDRRVGDFLAQV